MSRKNVQMRGLKVCVIGCSDRDNHHLAQQFSRIGPVLCGVSGREPAG